MTDDPKKVVDISLRRVQQRKSRGEQPYDDPILQSADEISGLYGRLAMRMPTRDLLVSIYLAERALYTALRHAIGASHADDVKFQAIEQACNQYSLQWPEHENRETVFDKERIEGYGDREDEPPDSTG